MFRAFRSWQTELKRNRRRDFSRKEIDMTKTLALKTRPLGSSGLEITTLGFGSWAAGGGGWAFGWGPQDDTASLAAMRHALELGVNWIDTAAAYGLGHSDAPSSSPNAGWPGRGTS